MKVKDLIEKLKEYPEDTIVQVIDEQDVDDRGDPKYFPIRTEMFYFVDFREGANKFVTEGDPLHGKTFLEIG